MRKQELIHQALVAVHKGLAKIFDVRLFQHIRPELCMKLETVDKHGEKMEYFVQLIGYYHDTLCGVVVYKSFEDFSAMIYKQQSIEQLTAASKASYVVFLRKDYDLKHTGGSGGGGRYLSSFSQRDRQNTPYDCPKSRLSLAHWNMIKDWKVCATDSIDGQLVVPSFTPRLDQMTDPQATLYSLIWILDCLFFLYKHRFAPLPQQFEVSVNEKFKLHRNQNTLKLSHPFGLHLTKPELLPLRPWSKSLPFIFAKQKNCGDGLLYFEQKIKASFAQLKAKKVEQENYILDPSGFDYVTNMRGLVGVQMKMAVLSSDTTSDVYKEKCLSNLDFLLTIDKNDATHIRTIKYKCLLYARQFDAYLEEIKNESFYSEQDIHRCDSAISWNITFCLFKLHGRKHQKVIESIKKSLQFHEYLLYVLIGMKACHCTAYSNQKELQRHYTYFYDYGHFWLSDRTVFTFIIIDVLYYYLDSKTRPMAKFLVSPNRPFTIRRSPAENDPHCSNIDCSSKSGKLVQCKSCETSHFCSDECKKMCTDNKHGIQCEMIKKAKHIYVHYTEVLFAHIVDDEKQKDVVARQKPKPKPQTAVQRPRQKRKESKQSENKKQPNINAAVVSGGATPNKQDTTEQIAGSKRRNSIELK
mmetsp:Transcript_36378/g.59775  ORF Transcript_36378/g.59775 Transcript_36378/m.59775 type:complete len:638 (+) Transcript_36378:108-2021(+)